MKMDAFAALVKHRESAPRKIKVHKTYINEDPNVEEVTDCPKCWSRNQQSSVRYMFINMNEAIYKCEAANCMYPFRNFKYKNYTDKTVYYYTALEGEEPMAEAEPLLDVFLEASSPCKNLQPSSVKSGAGNSSFDFNLDCFSPEKATSGAAAAPLNDIKTPDRNIFGSPSLLNLVKDFDTGFIDDILSELGGAGSPEKKSSPIARVIPPKPVVASKQLKRCLQMFQQPPGSEAQGVFKVPPIPGTEATISPKSKSRKSPGHHRRHKHHRRLKHSPSSSAHPTGPISSERMLQKSGLSPIQFITSLNSIKPPDKKEPTPPISGIQRLGNQKVERMLNFIERSMKKRDPANPSPPDPGTGPPTPSLKRAKQFKSARRKETKKLSLSAAVLQDSQFEYDGTAEQPQDEGVVQPVPPPPPPPEEPLPVAADSPVKEVTPSPQKKPAAPVLPSFDELIDFIHPPAFGRE